MIYQFTKDLASNLHARKFPVAVHYGPEMVSRVPYTANLLVIERNEGANEPVTSSTGQTRNPRYLRVRTLACSATLYSQSGLRGARASEHQHECDTVVDGIISAIYDWGVESKAGEIQFGVCRYLRREEYGFETWPGVAYRLEFGVHRRVSRMDYDGSGLQTSEPIDTLNIEVSADGAT